MTGPHCGASQRALAVALLILAAAAAASAARCKAPADRCTSHSVSVSGAKDCSRPRMVAEAKAKCASVLETLQRFVPAGYCEECEQPAGGLDPARTAVFFNASAPLARGGSCSFSLQVYCCFVAGNSFFPSGGGTCTMRLKQARNARAAPCVRAPKVLANTLPAGTLLKGATIVDSVCGEDFRWAHMVLPGGVEAYVGADPSDNSETQVLGSDDCSPLGDDCSPAEPFPGLYPFSDSNERPSPPPIII